MDLPQLPDDALSPANVKRDRAAWARAFRAAFSLLGLLWLIYALERLLDTRLRAFALFPGKLEGLVGILTAPLLHGDMAHLVANSSAVLILMTLAFYTYPRAAFRALPLIWIGAGVGVWLFARPSFHLGASGLTHGLMLFLFVLGILRRDRISVAVALAVFFLYGGMLLGVLPREAGISYEYHFFGALFGGIAAWRWWKLDPKPPKRVYSYELDEDLDSGPDPDDELRLPPADAIEPIWQGPQNRPGGRIVPFDANRRRRPLDPDPPGPDERLH
jgi:membrane associated rhomboid family serine protease